MGRKGESDSWAYGIRQFPVIKREICEKISNTTNKMSEMVKIYFAFVKNWGIGLTFTFAWI